jgi:predicted permease
MSDVRYAVRALAGSPGFTCGAVVALALGIGANTAMFSLVDAVLFRPLPVQRPSELVRIFSSNEDHRDLSNQSYPVFTDYRDGSDAFAGLAAYADAEPAHLSTGTGKPERVVSALVTGSYFPLLRIRPELGRLLGEDDDRQRGGHPVVVLSHATWRRRFGADPSVVGKSVRVNGHPFTVVGVTPAGFWGVGLTSLPELWIPLAMAAQVSPALAQNDAVWGRRLSWLDIVGRLKPDVTVAQAQAHLDVIAARRASGQPPGERDRWAAVVSATQAALDPYSGERATARTSWILLGVVALVLLIACVNASGLMLVRAERRQRELAIRMAVGASRARIVRQLLAESLLLSAMGGLAGLLVAAWGADLVDASDLLVPADLATPLLDPRVLAFTTLVAVSASVLFGLLPALRASRTDLIPALKREASSLSWRARRVSLRHAFAVAQVALSIVLLAGTGLPLRTLHNASRVDPGFQAERALVASFDLARQGYRPQQGAAVLDRLLVRARSLPGVEAAALARNVPVSSSGMRISLRPEGFTSDPEPHVDYNVVTPGFFQALGIPFLSGRDFEERDAQAAPGVAIVNDAFARRFWPDGDAVGRRLGGLGPGGGEAVVVGVVRTAKYRSLREDPRPVVYVPLRQAYLPRMTIVLRGAVHPDALVQPLAAAVEGLDPDLPLFAVRPLRDQLAAALARERALARLFGAFGALALVLAATGLYSVVAYGAELRTREFGIRMALGADPRSVARLVQGQGLALAAVGLVLGLAACLPLTRAIERLLFGVTPLDATTLAAAAALLLSTCLTAVHVPARRATRVDPATALRAE